MVLQKTLQDIALHRYRNDIISGTDLDYYPTQYFKLELHKAKKTFKKIKPKKFIEKYFVHKAV